MDKTLQAVLDAAAHAYFVATKGPGSWSEREQWTPVTNPMLGLSVGDIVFNYDTDEGCVTECRVASVLDGVAYYVEHDSNGKPYVWPITADDYAATVEGVVELYREEIQFHMDFMADESERLRQLQSIVGEIQR